MIVNPKTQAHYSGQLSFLAKPLTSGLSVPPPGPPYSSRGAWRRARLIAVLFRWRLQQFCMGKRFWVLVSKKCWVIMGAPTTVRSSYGPPSLFVLVGLGFEVRALVGYMVYVRMPDEGSIERAHDLDPRNPSAHGQRHRKLLEAPQARVST